MTIAALIPLVVKASVVLTVFALGLRADADDVLSLRKRPALLLRSLLAMDVLMPVAAVGLAMAFDLHPAVKIALVAVALSPVPPILPRKQLKAGGSQFYVFGLIVAAGLFAIAFIPLALTLIEQIFAVPLQMSSAAVAKIVLLTTLAPLAMGMVVRRVTPAAAERIAEPLSAVSLILLLAGAQPILVTAWPAMVSLIGNGTLAALAAFVVVGLAAGHILGGPDPADRATLAFATASRHPGVALAIATATFPQQRLVMPAVLLYLITGAVLSALYSRWGKGGVARDDIRLRAKLTQG